MRLVLLSALGFLGCLGSTNPLAPLAPGGTHVLFIGNSLTYVNDLPGTLASLALSSGDTLRVQDVSKPDFALVDHLNEGSAMRAINQGGWQFVVLQQGPSSVQVNRDSLIAMTRIFDAAIKQRGARSALYSVWPEQVNYSTFPRAIESYQLAAQAVNGTYMPVAAAWLAAWAKDPSLALYSTDGLHPTPLGTYLAALVMYEAIVGKDARQLPAVAVAGGPPLTEVPTTTVRLLQQVAHETNSGGAALQRTRASSALR